MSENTKLRCAVYTRKSSEEGLDQAFNSLDAQREACVAYITSQASLGWKLLSEAYDDGGITGGTLERPGIKRLLTDIRNGKVDVIVVYKIDRLTRSLMDFARLVEIFDKHSVSFVSVTQQFNTTTSMGRLTLNVLLSFAQFEREVTAERIRDKIAASKKKGLWMGGPVPLGYKAENRCLVIDNKAASIVRWIFDRYLQLGSVQRLREEISQHKMMSPRRMEIGEAVTDKVEADREETDRGQIGKSGDDIQTNPIRHSQTSADTLSDAIPELPGMAGAASRGMLYNMLSNPIYIGKIRHKSAIHDGEHAPIIDEATFDAVQQMLQDQASNPKGSRNHPDIHLLTGILADDTGHILTPVHTTNHNRRYRYYVTDARRLSEVPSCKWRLPASLIEPIVLAELNQSLNNRSQLLRWIQLFANPHELEELASVAANLSHHLATSGNTQSVKGVIQILFSSITLGQDRVTYTIRPKELCRLLQALRTGDDWDTLILHWERSRKTENRAHLMNDAPTNRNDSLGAQETQDLLTFERRSALKRRGVETKLVIEGPNQTPASPDTILIDRLVRAHLALDLLTAPGSPGLNQVATAFSMDASDLGRILVLAYLSPKITNMILTGTQPAHLTLRTLVRETDLPMDWGKQEALLLG